MQLIVCGSRDCRDAWMIETVLAGCYLEALGDKTGRMILYEGGQKQTSGRGVGYIGADYIASRWAEYKLFQLGKTNTSFTHVQTPADWNGRHGRGAGFVRNAEQLGKLLAVWKPELERAVCLGFLTKRRDLSPGTDHMMGLAERAGIPTYPIDTQRGHWYVEEATRRAGGE